MYVWSERWYSEQLHKYKAFCVMFRNSCDLEAASEIDSCKTTHGNYFYLVHVSEWRSSKHYGSHILKEILPD